MSRTKKSRKSATAPKAKPKLSKKELTQVEKRPKKLTGKKPGNRQLEAQKKSYKTSNTIQQDPRIGSKKPIVLIKESVSKKVEQKNNDEIAPINFAEIESMIDEILIDEDALMAELTAIEQDERLQKISIKEADEVTSEEVDYFNDKMMRHQEICQLLGIEYGEDAEGEEEVSSSSIGSSTDSSTENRQDEDALWDKLDNNNFMDNLQHNFSQDEDK